MTGELLSVDYLDGVDVSMAYDGAGRLLAIEDLWYVDEQDAAARIERERFANGVTAIYAHDALGQIRDISLSADSAGLLYKVHVDRNLFGAIASIDDQDEAGLNHDATFVYDEGARLKSATIGLPAEGHVFSYSYDVLQNMTARSGAAQGSLVGEYLYG